MYDIKTLFSIPLIIFTCFIAILITGIILKITIKEHYLPDGRLYKKKNILTPTERKFFYKLKKSIPELIIFVQVPFGCIVEAKTLIYKEKRRLFWKINQKRVDFLICDQHIQTVCIIELDDNSHHHKKHLDQKRDDFFAKNGIKTIRYNVKEINELTEERIKNTIYNLKK